MAGIETDSYMNANEIPNIIGEVAVYSSGEYSVEGNPKTKKSGGIYGYCNMIVCLEKGIH